MPQSLMSGDEAFDIPSAVGIGLGRLARQHQFEHLQNVTGHLDIGDVAGMMEGDEQFVFEPARMSSNGEAGLRTRKLASGEFIITW